MARNIQEVDYDYLRKEGSKLAPNLFPHPDDFSILPESKLDIDKPGDMALGDIGAMPLPIAEVVQREAFPIVEVPKTPLELLVEERPRINVHDWLIHIKEAVGYKKRGDRFKTQDILKFFIRARDGKVDSYQARLEKLEKEGRMDSSSYGIGELNGQRFVMFDTHFDVLGGSVDIAMGPRYEKALELAEKEHLPFVMAIAGSGGVRQQEGTPALEQMTLMAVVTARFKEKTGLPVIAVLAGKVYGGTSASFIPLADTIVAMEGSDFGFSGPNVIESYQGTPIKPGDQSVEAHTIDGRLIDALFHSEHDFIHWLSHYLAFYQVLEKRKREKKKPMPVDLEKLTILRKIPDAIRFPFGRIGFFNALQQQEFEEKIHDFSQEALTALSSERSREELYDDFERLKKDPRRFDTAYLMTMLDNPVPLYSAHVVGDRIYYPGIIAALGTIDGIPVMIIGEQPSYYQKRSGEIGKIPSSPIPQDFEDYQRMIELAERYKMIVVSHVDTLGAKPTVDAERRGQAIAIGRTIAKANLAKVPIFTVISGLGSGGGIAIAPWGERVMLPDGFSSVAEPSSSAAIRVKGVPDTEDTKEQLKALRTTAEDQKRFGLVDEVVPISNGQSYEHPELVVAKIRDIVVNFATENSQYNPDKIVSARIKKIQNTLRGFLKAHPTKK